QQKLRKRAVGLGGPKGEQLLGGVVVAVCEHVVQRVGGGLGRGGAVGGQRGAQVQLASFGPLAQPQRVGGLQQAGRVVGQVGVVGKAIPVRQADAADRDAALAGFQVFHQSGQGLVAGGAGGLLLGLLL